MNRPAYMPKPKYISIVVDYGDGAEHPFKPKERKPMAQPGTARLPIVKSRVTHLLALTERAFDLCGHWDKGLAKHLDTAGSALDAASRFLTGLPEGFVAPRKPVTRKFNALKAGDIVRLTDKAAKKYMGKLAGKPLTVVSIADGWAEVQLEGDAQKPTVETKHLIAA